MNIEKIIKETFYSLLMEQDEQQPEQPSGEKKPEEKKKRNKKEAEPGSINIAPGSVGRGRFKEFVGEAGARAESDPEGLMEDLGVKNPGGSCLDSVKGVLQRAIAFNSLMSQAYAGASGSRVKFEDSEQPVSGVRIAVSEISTRDGIKFISHTLTGAKNAGMLNLDKAIEIGLYDGQIFIKEI